MLAAIVWHSSKIRTIDDFHQLPGEGKGKFLEWLVAQEIWRRQAVRGHEIPEALFFWKSDEHEIEFVLPDQKFIEVKTGASSPFEFDWFTKIFPKGHLTIVTPNAFETNYVHGMPMETFLKETD